MTLPLALRPLTTLADFQRIVDCEIEIWGYGNLADVVGLPILAVSAKCGGILIGAFEGDEMAGFVYSLPGIRHGLTMQWSHMLGVREWWRSSGLGRILKLAQRDRAIEMGLDLIEWTYDPLQALNAHLNFAKLGGTVEEYVENIYGESASVLHKGTPTDRFICQWWIRQRHVERRVHAISDRAPGSFGEIDARCVNQARPAGRWMACESVDLTLDGPNLLVQIPTGFTELQATEPELAYAWRMATRRIFETYFGRGYRAVDFFLNRAAGVGAYLLATRPADDEAADRERRSSPG